MKSSFRYFLGLFIFIFFKINNIRIIYRYIFGFFLKELHISKFFFNGLYKNKNEIFKDINFVKFLEKNNYPIFNNKINYKKKILVECLINHPIYTLGQCVLSKCLSKNTSSDIIVIIRKGDIRTKLIFQSFGVKRFITVDKFNLFSEISFFFKSIKILSNFDDIGKILKYKMNGIEIGKSIYEHHGRFVGYHPKKFNWKLVQFLSQALLYLDKSNNIIKKYSPNYWIQSETQFIPHRIFIQNALKKKIKVISRSEIKKVGIKIYKNFLEKNINRHKIPKNLFNFVYKKFKIKILKNFNKIYLKRKKIDLGKEIHQKITNKNKVKLKIKSKKHLRSIYKWNNENPIVLILSHEMTDGNFGNSWNLFKNDSEWLKHSINFFKNKKINLLVKKHPSEKYYNSKINTEKIFKDNSENENNIQMFNDKYNLEDVVDYIDLAITSHGSAGYQYPSMSIPTVICGETFYSNLGFTLEPKTIKAYYKIINNVRKIKKLKPKIVNKAKIFYYIFSNICRVEMPLIYYSNIRMDYDKESFWKNTLDEKKNIEKKILKFNKYFEHQIKNNNSLIVNFDEFEGLKKLKF